jgi:uncharacterized protein
MTAFLIIAASVAIGALVQGTIGVGFALIVVPVAALLRPDLLSVAALALMVPLNIYVLAREWRALDWTGGLWILFGRLLGTGGGILIFLLMTPRMLDLLVGASTVAAVAVTLWLPLFRADRWAFFGAGVVTGVTETAVGIGGPPLALVYQHNPAPVIRATIAACFLVGQLFSLAIMVQLGKVARTQVDAIGWLLLPLTLGAVISQVTHNSLNPQWMRGLILVFAAGSGLVLIGRSLVGVYAS